MVAVTNGLGLGLFGSSARDQASTGPAMLGRGRERVYINATTGNLIIQSQDERLSALGLDLALVRTYNSQGLLNDDNGDNWRLGIHQQVYALTGSLNTANSTITKVFGDGREVVYRYDTGSGRYLSTDGEGAHDTLLNSSGTWTWTDGSARNTETYDSNGRLVASRDADGNTVTYGYTGSLLTQITDASGQITYLDYSGNNLTQIRVVSNGQTQTLTRYTYDANNRLTQVRVDLSPADNAVTDGQVFTTTYTYDGTSKRIASISQSDGSSVAFTYELVNGVYRIKTYEEGAPASVVPANSAVLQNTETVTTTTNYNLNTSATNAPGWANQLSLTANVSRLVMNASGDGLLVWGDGNNILARFYKREADTWGPTFTVQSGISTLVSASLQAAMDDAGNALVSYTREHQPPAFPHSIYARSFSAATQSWSAEQLLGAGAPGGSIGFYQYEPGYSISLKNNVGAVSWLTQGGGVPGSIYVARFNNGTWGPTIAAENSAGQVGNPTVRVANNGDVMVVWTSEAATGNGLFVNRWRVATGTWSGPTLLATGASTLTELEFDNAGNAFVVWRTGSAERDVQVTTSLMVRRLNAATGVWEAAQTLVQHSSVFDPQWWPFELAIDASGNLLVAYHDNYSYETFEIKTRQYDAATNAWGAAKTIVGSRPWYDEGFNEPLVPMMNNGRLILAWEDRDHTWWYSRQENGVWGAPQPFITGNRRTSGIDIKLDDRGNMLAAWDATVSRYAVDRTYLLPANPTWESVAQALYGSTAAAATLRSMMGNPPLVGGTVLRNPPASFSVTTSNTYSVAPYYTVLPGDTWETITQAVYGTNAAGAVNALRSALSNTTLQTGMHLTMPLSLAYSGSGRRTTFTYSQADGRTDVQDALGYVTSYFRDAQGRLSSVLSPAIGGGARLETRYGYDADGNLTSITEDPTGLNRTVTMEYDSRGNMLSKRDTLGNTITRTYDAQNQLLTESRIAGQTAHYVYDSESHLRFEITADGRVTEHQYNTNGERVATLSYTGTLYSASTYTESDLAAWANARDKSQLERIDYTYDFRGNVSTATAWSQTTSAGAGAGTASITQFVYDQRGQLLQTIDARGSDYLTSHTYDGMGRLLTTTEWLSAGVTRTTINTYDDANRLVRTTLANGLVTTQTYNLLGELVSVTNDLGLTQGTTTYVYDNGGRLAYVTDPTGARQFYIYDEADRKIAQIDGDGSLTEFIYDRTGAVIKTIAYATRISEATRTTMASTNTVTLANLRTEAGTIPSEDRITRQVYNAARQLVYSIDAIGAVTEYRYDGAGRLTDTLQRRNIVTIARSVDQVLPANINIANHEEDRRTRTFYDNDGQIIGILDAEGSLTEYIYDAAGRRTRDIGYANKPAASVLATGSFADLKSSADVDNETALDPERDAITYYFYDGQGRQTGILDAEGYLTETVFNVAGHVAERIRYDVPLTYTAGATVDSLRNGVGTAVIRERTVYTRDGLGQVTSETTTRGTSTAGASSTTSYGYDLIGNVTSETRADRTIEKRYDRLGRLIAELSAEGRALITAGMSQDDINNIWNRYGVTYAYDVGGRRISATERPNDTQTNITLYFYDADNRLRFVLNPLGERTEYRYNAFGQLQNEIRYWTRISTSDLTGGLLGPALETTLTASPDPVRDSRKTYLYTRTGSILLERTANTENTAEDWTKSYSYNVFGENDITFESGYANQTLRTDFTYDKRGRLTLTRWDNVSGGFNKTETRTYDTFGRLRSVTDARLNTKSYEYDRLGRVLVSVDVESTDRTITTYDAFSRTLTIRDALNNLTRYEYDDVNRRSKLITPEGIEVVTQFTVHGQTQWVTSAGNTTTYEYDLNGKIKSISDTLGTLETRTYDRRGRQVTQTDARGTLTRFTYDAADRALTRTVESGEGAPLVTSYVYDGQGRLQDVTEPNGRLTRTTYDRSGRVTLVAVDPNGLNIRTRYSYDRSGNVVRVTEGEGSAKPRVKEYWYDTLGRRTREIADPGSGTDPATGLPYLNLITQYRYDLNDNLTRKIDASGYYSTWYVYDAHNRLTHTIDYFGGVTSMTYDAEDHVIATRRHKAYLPESTLLEFQRYDRPPADFTVDVSVDDKVSRSVYDRDGREKYVINALGVVTERQFDANGNVVRERVISSPTLTGTYNTAADVTTALGSAASTINADDRVQWTTYDVRGQAVFSIDGSGAVTQTRYDVAGNVTSVTQFAVLRSTASPTDLASMQTWADSNASNALNRTTRYFYDTLNRLRFKVDGEGYITELQYDIAGRQEIQITFVTPTTAAPTTYAEALVAADSVRNALDQKTTTLFDAAGRASRITDSVGNYKEYTYDANDNVLTYRNEKGAVWNYVYDALGRLTEEASPSVSVTIVSDSGNGLASSTSEARIISRYSYDHAGNLYSKIEGIRRFADNTISSVGARTTTYTYDPLGRQIRTYFPTVEIYAGGYTNLSSSTPLQSREVYSATVYDSLGNATSNLDVAGNYSYKVYDALGRVRYEIDALNYVTEHTYDAFGNELTTTRFAQPLSVLPPRYEKRIALSDMDAAVAGLRNDAANRTIVKTYDRVNRVVSVSQPSVLAFAPTAGASGGRTFTTSPITYYEYNATGQVIREWRLIDTLGNSVVDPRSSPTTNQWATTHSYFDRRGYKIAEVDALRFLSMYEYDETGDLTRQREFAIPLSNFNPASATPPAPPAASVPGGTVTDYGLDRERVYVYDQLNRLKSESLLNVQYGQYVGWVIESRVGTRTKEYRYDAVGNQVYSIEDNDIRYTYYDALGRVIAATEAQRNRGNDTWLTPITEMRRDAFGNLVEEIGYGAGAASTSLTAYTLAATTPELERHTLLKIDSHGRVVKSQDPNGAVRNAAYNARGDLVKEWQDVTNRALTDLGATPTTSVAETLVTMYQYDVLGRRTVTHEAQTASSVVRSRAQYNSFGEITQKSVDGGWTPEYYQYDNGGRLWRTNSGDGVDKVYLYDLAGRATVEIRSRTIDLADPAYTAATVNGIPGTMRTESRYDLLGRMVENRLPQFNSSGSIATPTTLQQFDRWGNVVNVTSVDGGLTTYRYNQINQLTVTQLPLATVLDTRFSIEQRTQRSEQKNTYDLYGRLMQATDGNGGSTRAFYNFAGQMIMQINADDAAQGANGSRKKFVYDAFGNQIQVTDELGYRSRFVYDGANNLVQVAREIETGGFYSSSPTDTSATSHTRVLWEYYGYDQSGRRTSETNGEGEVTKYWYDLRGNLIRRRTPRNFDTTYEYDAFSRKTRETDANGSYSNWTYDAFGRTTAHRELTNETSPNFLFQGQGATHQYWYDEAGLLTLQTNSNGLRRELYYDTAGHLTSLVDNGAATVESGLLNTDRLSTYEYDSAGRKRRETVSIAGRLHQDTTIGYDARGRISSLNDQDYQLTYSYDANGNRTLIQTTYRDHQLNQRTQQSYYRYDAMNRVTISQGYRTADTVPDIGINSSQGVKLTYNARGERTSIRTAGTRFAIVDYVTNGVFQYRTVTQITPTDGMGSEYYSYDGLGRMTVLAREADKTVRETTTGETVGGSWSSEPVNVRSYDKASRLLSDTNYILEGSSLVPRVTTTTYDDDGRTDTQVTSKNGVLESVVRFGDAVDGNWYRGYDAGSVLRGYSVEVYQNGSYRYTSTYANFYRFGEGYQESLQSVSSSGSGAPQAGSTSRTYNVNNELVQFTDSRDAARTRYFANNAAGQALTVIQGQFDGASGRMTLNQAWDAAVNRTAWGGSYNQPKAQYFFFADGNYVGSFGQLQNAANTFVANFDVNYTPISNEYPDSAPSQVIVQAGETLRTIAARVFGDATLWYIIAEANGLTDPSAVLQEGVALEIPNDVVPLSNASGVFKPYEPSKALGDTTPTQPAPPAPRSKKGCGVFGKILIVVVAVVVSYFTAGVATGAIGGVLGTGATATAVASTAGAVIGAAVGSIVSQGVAIAIGEQDGFSWKSVAAAALAAGLAPGASSVSGSFGSQIASAAINSAVNQGVNIALGLQEKFNWKAVAAAAVAAPVASRLGDKVGSAVGKALKSDFVGNVVGNFTQGLTNQVAYASFTGGKINYTQIAADSFGNALGNSIIAELTMPPQLRNLSKEQQARVMNLAGRVGADINDPNALNVLIRAGETYSDKYLSREEISSRTADYLRLGGASDSEVQEVLDLYSRNKIFEPQGVVSIEQVADGESYATELQAPRQAAFGSAYVDDALVGAGAVLDTIGKTIDANPIAKYALIGLDVAAGPVAYAVRETLDRTFIGDVRRAAEDRVGDYASDKLSSVGRSQEQADYGGAGAVGLLSLVGGGAVAALAKATKVLRASAQKRAAQEVRQKAMEEYRATIDNEFGQLPGGGTFVGTRKKMTPKERAFADEQVALGRHVKRLPTSDEGKTPDFQIDGVRTEYKGLDKLGRHTIKNNIEEAHEQAGAGGQIVIDARGFDVSRDQALEQIRRANGNVKTLQNRVTVLTDGGPVKF